jgi:hypothetical protein
MLTLSTSFFNTIQFALEQKEMQEKKSSKHTPTTRVYDVNNKVDSLPY